METSELNYVRNQLQERKGSWPTISKETSVPYSSLAKVARGETEDPGVKMIEKLGRYLRLLERQEAERAALGGERQQEAACG